MNTCIKCKQESEEPMSEILLPEEMIGYTDRIHICMACARAMVAELLKARREYFKKR